MHDTDTQTHDYRAHKFRMWNVQPQQQPDGMQLERAGEATEDCMDTGGGWRGVENNARSGHQYEATRWSIALNKPGIFQRLFFFPALFAVMFSSSRHNFAHT